MKKKLVLKIWTSTLTAWTQRISYAKIEDIARQILFLGKEYNIILVSSWAIATAKQFSHIHGSIWDVPSKQALSAIGQPVLMRIYEEVFSSFGLHTAQCLLTYTDIHHKTSRENIKNTLTHLLQWWYIPIINENDTVWVEEIIVGDNDQLSAHVACIIDADLLVLASDIDGLYTKNPHLYDDAVLIPEVIELASVAGTIQERDSEHGTGGMTTKFKAISLCKEANIPTWIVNWWRENFLVDAIQWDIDFTKFL